MSPFPWPTFCLFFFFNDTATTEIYTLSLHDALPISAAGPLAAELIELLHARNGFYAFGPALHIFPSESTDLSWGLLDWNMPGLWKHEYADFVDPGLCFAEDVFGNQFSIKAGTVHHFAVETGTLKPIAASLAKRPPIVLADDR